MACDQAAQNTNANSDDSNPPSKDEVKKDEPTIEQYGVLITVADKLRMRDKPNLKSEVMETLPINTPLIYLNEQSEQKEKIKIGDIEHNAHWLKVKTKGGDIGWVYGSQLNYGGMVEFLKESKTKSLNPVEIVANLSASKIESLSGLKGIKDNWENYGGYYQYKMVDGEKKMDGPFHFRARRFNKDYDYWMMIRYSGNYVDGFPKGDFVENHEFYAEGRRLTTIVYEGGNYSCSLIYSEESAEGEKQTNKEENPKSCSFSALE